MEIDEVLSEAVCLYLGVGTASYPQRDERAVGASLGPLVASDTVAKITELLHEVDAFPVVWDRTTELEAVDEMARSMARRHPELSAAAIEALKWQFTWIWK